MISGEQTIEVSQIRLKLKDNLRFSYRAGSDTPWYMVEDESTGKFFQIGLPQYTFLSLLDGTRTIGEALMRSATLLNEHALTEQDIASLSKWAIESGLLESEGSGTSWQREESARKDLVKKSMTWMNPITMKIPLAKPDAWLEGICPWFAWLFSPLCGIIWLIVVVLGFSQLAVNFDRFLNNRVSSFGSNDVFWFAVAWLALKLVHEFGHAITCKHYGGNVASCGALFLLMIPLPFVDVTSSWRFQNRWHRILTSAAGMLAEIFIAAIACWVWASADPGPLQFHTGNLIIAATLHTILFNANPLMRFDAYYILADLVSIPNLYTHGRGYVKSFFKWIFLGNKPKPLAERGIRAWMVKGYGFFSIAWFGLISVSLMLGALSLFEGIGLLIAVVGGALMYGLPIFRFCKFIAVGTETEAPKRKRFFGAVGITTLLVGGLLWLCPAPSTIKAPVVIDYLPLSTIRSQATGFLDSILVKHGEEVVVGMPIGKLSNPDLDADLESLKIDLKVSELKINAHLNNGEVAALKVEREAHRALLRQHDELEMQIGHLTLVANADGTVLSRDLEENLGRYMQPGDEFCSIGNRQMIGAKALLQQDDAKWLEDLSEYEVSLLVWGESNRGDVVEAKIDRVYPRATRSLPHPAFAASNGGPMAVVSRNEVEGSGEAGEMLLTYPHVLVDLKLHSQHLASGQTGLMFLKARHQNLGQYLYANTMRFFRRNTVRTHGL